MPTVFVMHTRDFKSWTFHMQINFEEMLVVPSFNMSSLNSSDIESNNMTMDAMNITEIDIQYSQPVETAPVYLFCCALSLAAISAFLRAGFVLKFICMMCCIAIQGCVLSLSRLFEFYDHEIDRTRFVLIFFLILFYINFWEYNLVFAANPKCDIFHQFFCSNSHFGLTTTGVFFLMLIAIVLHILDRQGDRVARSDFLWKAKLKTEQEEVETMRGINKVTF